MRVPIPDWTAELRGKPYAAGGDGPTHFDCWGAVRAALEIGFGISVPVFGELRVEDELRLLEAARAGRLETDDGAVLWPVQVERLEDLRAGDVIEFRGERLHVGVMASDRHVLQAIIGDCVHVGPVRRAPWPGLFLRGYRHRELTRAAV